MSPLCGRVRQNSHIVFIQLLEVLLQDLTGHLVEIEVLVLLSQSVALPEARGEHHLLVDVEGVVAGDAHVYAEV